MSPRKTNPLSMEFVILGLLNKKPMHGYELHHTLNHLPGIAQIWRVKQALLYAKLEQLENSRYLEVLPSGYENVPSRRVFHVTEVGGIKLNEWLTTPVLHPREIRQEFIAKMVIARLYDFSLLRSLCTRQIDQARRWLDNLKGVGAQAYETSLDDWFVYSFRSAQLNSILAWLEEVEEKIIAEEKHSAA